MSLCNILLHCLVVVWALNHCYRNSRKGSYIPNSPPTISPIFGKFSSCILWRQELVNPNPYLVNIGSVLAVFFTNLIAPAAFL